MMLAEVPLSVQPRPCALCNSFRRLEGSAPGVGSRFGLAEGMPKMLKQ